jgi:predicted transcriptional regulator
MRNPIYKADDLKQFLITNIVATMLEMQAFLGTQVTKTVLRKLKELSYRSSYSHGGRYYTLDQTVQFDHHGLWSYNDVRFSQQGSLMDTLRHVVDESHSGYFADELQELLAVSVKESLLRLVNKGLLSREKTVKRYLYCSAEPTLRKQQLLSRSLMETAEQELSDEAKAAIILFLSVLDEKQRRLYAGVEAIKYGLGGDRWIADLLGMHPQTVARGRRELLTGDVEIARARKAGGGRKPVEKKRRS